MVQKVETIQAQYSRRAQGAAKQTKNCEQSRPSDGSDGHDEISLMSTPGRSIEINGHKR
ncbi:hypothetical protein A2U01_0088638, partial [Trifolium medium]|nr:hypothetical protein [Trifolium medium]